MTLQRHRLIASPRLLPSLTATPPLLPTCLIAPQRRLPIRLTAHLPFMLLSRTAPLTLRQTPRPHHTRRLILHTPYQPLHIRHTLMLSQRILRPVLCHPRMRKLIQPTRLPPRYPALRRHMRKLIQPTHPPTHHRVPRRPRTQTMTQATRHRTYRTQFHRRRPTTRKKLTQRIRPCTHHLHRRMLRKHTLAYLPTLLRHQHTPIMTLRTTALPCPVCTIPWK
jgi:hypothetical protein